jgi:catechol 2,3-dioxygenase-like lactoylglutathione lyase family enzyme
MDLEQLDHVALTVADVERSMRWYRDVLGFEKRHDEWDTEPAMMCIGSTCVALFESKRAESPPPAGHDMVALRHLAFRASREMFERAQVELGERGIEFSFMDHETAHSIYFADPDGHRLEITTYELGTAAAT